MKVTKSVVVIPMLLRAAGIMLSVNFLVALWFYFCPTLELHKTASAATEPPARVVAGKVAGKRSPFESFSKNSRPKPVRLPVRIQPALSQVASPEMATSIANGPFTSSKSQDR
jgi:hypothetical protein